MGEVSDTLSTVHDRLIDAELARGHAESRVARLERHHEAILAYLDSLHGPFADPTVLRDLLSGHAPA